MRRTIIALCLALPLTLAVSASASATPTFARATRAAGPVPLSYFRLPASVVGRSQFFAGEGSGGTPPPADAFFPGQTASEVGTYHYGVAPSVPIGTAPAAGAEAYYEVILYKTADAARQANAHDRDTVNDGSGKAFDALSIAQPVADNEWLRGRSDRNRPDALYCTAVGGVRYQNIRAYALVENFDSVNPAGYVACTLEDRWVTRKALQNLYPKLIAYVTAHGGAPATSTPSSPDARGSAGKTSIRVVRPFDPRGKTDPSFHLTSTVDGTCQGGSYVDPRADAYRCFAGSSILDPCFKNPAAGSIYLACVADPFDKDYTLFRLDGPLPAPYGKRSPAGQGAPWALTLASGQECGFESGATYAIGDLRLNYGCTPQASIYGDVNEKTQPWTALVWGGAPSDVPARDQLVPTYVRVAIY